MLIPTEAGTHFPGQCKAPAAIIHDGGLERKLWDMNMHDCCHGNNHTGILGPQEDFMHWIASPKIEGVRNLLNSLKVMHKICDYLSQNCEPAFRELFYVFLGGDCSISPAIFSGFSHWYPDKKVGLLYMDGDADLTLPSATSAEGSSGILDSMAMTHLTRREGGLECMKAFSHPDGSRLVSPEDVVLFGFDPLQPANEHWVYLLENGFKCYTRPTVRKDPVKCAKQALEWLEQRVDVILLHFDVDVIDSGLFPLANYPHYAGLAFEEAMAAMHVFIQGEKVLGMIITEFNPNNDPSRTMVTQLVDRLTSALKARMENLKLKKTED